MASGIEVLHVATDSIKIASEKGLERRRVLRALNIMREGMLQDIPVVSEENVFRCTWLNMYGMLIIATAPLMSKSLH